MYAQVMATKTISIDTEAYERLRSARLTPNESFSRVIKRAHWRSEQKTAGALLRGMETAPRVDLDILDRLNEAQRDDVPPKDPWTRG